MKRLEADEAAPIADRMLAALLGTVPAKGRPGSDARTAIGDTRANAYKLCINDALGPPLDECFDLARLAGSTFERLNFVRDPDRAGDAGHASAAGWCRDAGIRLCLATQCRMHRAA